jgi:hypothetical protein
VTAAAPIGSNIPHVTRAGTTTPYWWGSTLSLQQANYCAETDPNKIGKSDAYRFVAPWRIGRRTHHEAAARDQRASQRHLIGSGGYLGLLPGSLVRFRECSTSHWTCGVCAIGRE